MGWLGWTEQQTLQTTMASIIAAYKGRVDMFRALFGPSNRDAQQPRWKPATAANVKAILGRFG